jgi:hypothetical protein
VAAAAAASLAGVGVNRPGQRRGAVRLVLDGDVGRVVRNTAKSLSKGYASLQILQRYFTAKLNHLSATMCRYFVGQY